MSGTLVASRPLPTAITVEATRAQAKLGTYAVFLLQLALLYAVAYVFRIEGAGFRPLLALTFGGFAVHYWLPMAYKEKFFIALSIAGGFVLLDPKSMSLLLAIGLGFYGIVRSGLKFAHAVWAICAAGAALMYIRGANLFNLSGRFWAVFGAIFMFRLVVYLYDIRHKKGKPSLQEYLSYFFLLPNYYFILFPVIDFQTMRKSYFQKELNETAQTGIHWMVRGFIQLMLYRIVDHLRDSSIPDNITTAGSLVTYIVLTYLLYLKVSGHFHLIIGMLHLFGYNLPETHRKYLLSASLTDFWRRINIYWKDFMVKIVYFPVYFKLRKRGDMPAQVVATAAVFIVTWATHSYQYFWLKGQFLFSGPDSIFWGLLGLLVIVNLLWESKHKRKQPRTGWSGKLIHGLQVAGTFCFIATLWSLWSSPTVESWLDLMTYWKPGV